MATGYTSRRSLNGRNGYGPMARPESWDIPYDPKAVFPEVELDYGLTVQLVWVTPQIANEWLGLLHSRQRTLKAKHLQSLVSDHLAGRFRLNGETVIFDWDGYLIDGQHRCKMVVDAQKPALMLVVRNVAPETYSTIDDTAKRTGGDALRAIQVGDANRVAAAAAMLVRYERGMLTRSPIALSGSATEDVIRKHPGLINSVTAIRAHRDFPSMASLGFCHYILSGIDADAAATFFDHLRHGAGLPADSPILALRNRTYRQQVHRDELAVMVFKAWNYWRRNRPLKIVKLAPNEPIQKPV